MTHASHEKCPLDAVDRRLSDVHKFWHEAEENYFDPEGFRIAIQSAIQTLRTVTFILQSNKRLFPDFDGWYDPQVAALREDKLMRWMIDARNKIEKQGDLEMFSKISAKVVASYFDNDQEIEISANIFDDQEEIRNRAHTEALRAHIEKDGILRIQRRWVENTLPGHELLDAVALAYGKISLLVSSAHEELGLPRPNSFVGEIDHSDGVEARGGRLPCMIGHEDTRSLDIWIATGKPMAIEASQVKVNKKKALKALNKRGLDPSKLFKSTPKSAAESLDRIFGAAREIFLADGHHEMMVALLKDERIINMATLRPGEHGEKYLMMRMIADNVLRSGANGVIVWGEVWQSVFDPAQPFRRAADDPERRELLSATLVTKSGTPIQLTAKVDRSGKKLSLEDTVRLDDQIHTALSPIYTAWGRSIPEAWLNFGQKSEHAAGEDS